MKISRWSVGFAFFFFSLLSKESVLKSTIIVNSEKSPSHSTKQYFPFPLDFKRVGTKKRFASLTRNLLSRQEGRRGWILTRKYGVSTVAFSVPSVVVTKAIQWASVLGLQLKQEKRISEVLSGDNESLVESQNEGYNHLPLSLLPSIFPAKSFNEVVDIAPLFNKLIARISLDENFLLDIHKDVVKNDEFTRRLLQLYQKYGTASACSQPITMGLIRSDYLMDMSEENNNTENIMKEKSELLQVELNTIASSFGTLCGQANLLQTKLIESLPHSASDQVTTKDWYALLDNYIKSYYSNEKNNDIKISSTLDWSDNLQIKMAIGQLKSKLLKNPSTKHLPKGLYEAHRLYIETTTQEKKESCPSLAPIIMFVVQTEERNVFDQRLLEYKLWEDYGVNVIRQSLSEIYENCIVDEEGKLRLKLTMQEISVVYFRAGYTPSDYGTQSDSPEWLAREIIEQSIAIKCPNIGFHLAGTKKVQQALCEDGVVERFLSKEESTSVRRHFTGLYGLGEKTSNENGGFDVVKDARTNPQNYVLKPQREGGGNNLYDEDIAEALQTWSQDKLSSYILMERIKAPSHKLHLIRNGELYSGEGISELGIFGIYIGEPRDISDKTHMNEYGGYLVRSKMADVNEGGVAAGFAVVSSILLEDKEYS